jgi:methylenetetrahydrofolate reductase (NADPH)
MELTRPVRPAGPAGAAARDRHAQALAERLRRPRYEVLPLDGIEEAVLAHVPREVKVTVTASPRKGLEATLDLSERLAAAGYAVVPHLSARLVRDRAHLEEIVGRLRGAGVRELFVPAGDAQQPAGEFAGAAELLAAMGDLRAEFADIGITGYPESHHAISDEVTIQAMFEKAEMATCIISQICFDPAVIAWWIDRVRARGTLLPIWIGVPGIVDYAKLVRISMKIGLGESTRFLRHQNGWMRRLITRQFKPDALIRELAPTCADPAANVAGFHFYTFNEVARTERWRRQTLERLAA